MAETLPLMNVGQVNFDDRLPDGLERIEKSDRGMAVGAGIDHDSGKAGPRFLYPVDQLTFMIALPAIDLQPQAGGMRAASRFDIRQRVMAIDLRLAGSQQIEVGAVDNEDLFGHALWGRVRLFMGVVIARRYRCAILLWEGQRNPKADLGIGHGRRIAVSVGTGDHAGLIEPGAAPENAPARIAAFPGAAVGRRAVEGAVPAVLDPFREIAGGVEDAKGVAGKAAARRRHLIVPLAAATVAIGFVGVGQRAPP